MRKSSDFISQAKRLGGLTLASGLLGFLRELAIARKFGATHGTDSYLVALSIPSILYFVLVGSGLNIALVPKLASLMRTAPVSGVKVFSEFLSAVLVVGALISVVILVFPQELTRLFAPGVSSSSLTIRFVCWLSPLFFLFVCSYSLASFECARGRTAYWGIIGVTQNATIVLAILSLAGLLGVHVLAFGSLAGAMMVLLLQIHFVKRAGFHEPWTNPLRKKEGLKILYSMLPFAVAFGIGGSDGTGQADILLLRYFASRLDPGSITLLALGNKLMALPVLFVGASLGLAVLPYASADFSNDDHREVGAKLIRALTYAFTLICPVFVIFLNSSGWLARVFFGRGALTAVQLTRLGGILVAYSGALVGLTLVYVLTGFLAALGKRRFLIASGLTIVVVDAILMRLLSSSYRSEGLAMAVSIGALVYSSLLFAPLIRKFRGPVLAALVRRVALILAGAFVMFLLQRSILALNWLISGSSFILQVLSIALALVGFAAWVTAFKRRLDLGAIPEALGPKFRWEGGSDQQRTLSESQVEA